MINTLVSSCHCLTLNSGHSTDQTGFLEALVLPQRCNKFNSCLLSCCHLENSMLKQQSRLPPCTVHSSKIQSSSSGHPLNKQQVSSTTVFAQSCKKRSFQREPCVHKQMVQHLCCNKPLEYHNSEARSLSQILNC